jgi:mono/diheme cytochrome c family protein
MRTRLQKWSLLLGAAAVLALPLASWAQLSTYDIERVLARKATSETSPAMPRMPSRDYRRYCVGCHGTLGDGNGENASLDGAPHVPQAPRLPIGRLQVPLHSDRNLAYRPGSFRHHRLAALTAPTCRNGTPSPSRSAPTSWLGSSTSLRAGPTKNPEPITIPPEPEVTPERIKAGRDVFARVQCWKCHGVQGMANGPSASTLTDDLGRPIAPFNFTEGSRPKCGDTDQDIYRIFMTGWTALPCRPLPTTSSPTRPGTWCSICEPLCPKRARKRKWPKQLEP